MTRLAGLAALLVLGLRAAASADCDNGYLACRLSRMSGVSCANEPAATTVLGIGSALCVIAPKASGFSYSQPIALLIPAGLQKPSRLLLNLHGNRGLCPAVGAAPARIVKDFALMPQLLTQAPGAAMFFPMSEGATQTYDQELAGRFGEFSKWAEGLSGAPEGARWIVSGHSGAGRALAVIVGAQPANVDAALMLDAAYNVQQDKYAPLWKKAAGGRAKIYNVYTIGAGTSGNSAYLEDLLGKDLFRSRPAKTDDHCRVPSVEYGELLRQSL